MMSRLLFGLFLLNCLRQEPSTFYYLLWINLVFFHFLLNLSWLNFLYYLGCLNF
jgi:hypothetical protein